MNTPNAEPLDDHYSSDGETPPEPPEAADNTGYSEADTGRQRRDAARPETAVGRPPVPPAGAAHGVPGPQPPLLHKSPAIATFLALYPGLGHLYTGLYRRGVFFFGLSLGCVILIAFAELPAFAFLLSFVWLFNLMDAHRQTNLVNLGYVTDLGVMGDPDIVSHLTRGLPGWPSALFLMGITTFGFGALGLLERLDLWRWSYLEDYWFVLFLAAGAWLILLARRQRKALDEQAAAW